MCSYREWLWARNTRRELRYNKLSQYNTHYCVISSSPQKRVVRQRDGVGVSLGSGKGAELREKIIRRAALEFKNGMYGIQ